MSLPTPTRGAWWVVGASICGLLVGNGPVMQFTFGTLLPSISHEFGWSRGAVSSAIVLGLWVTGITTPLAGRLVDRFGVRAVALPAILVFSLSTAAVALVPPSRIAFTSVYALMGLAAAGQTPLVYAKAISARFDAQRGLALGVAMAGVGLGAALVPQYAQALIAHYGWRAAYAGLGALTFVLAFPAVALVVGQPLEQPETQPVPLRTLPGLTGREALRTSRFWVLAVSFFLVSATAAGVVTHLVPLLIDRGLSSRAATGLLGMAGLALIAGRLGAGFLLDRVHAPYVAVGFFMAPLAGVILLWASPRQDAAVMAAILVGIGLGAEVDLIAFLLSRYLGMRSFGELYGYFFALFMLGAGAGPFAMGVSFDRTGSYHQMLGCAAIAMVLACALMLRLGAYAYPVGHRLAPETVA